MLPAIAWAGPAPAVAVAESPPASVPSREGLDESLAERLQPILPLGEIRPGMRGYGLTVFRGRKVEPFPVEVISVVSDFAPKRGVIWIRCPGERMQQSGPVQGMSGSPIYLWTDDVAEEDRQLGEGGRLIGAFAYGINASKDCFAGVQPIEQMREAAARMSVLETDDADAEAGAGADGGRAGRAERDAAWAALSASLDAAGVGEAAAPRMKLTRRLASGPDARDDRWRDEAFGGSEADGTTAPLGRLAASLDASDLPDARGVAPLGLPLSLSASTPETARLLAPLWRPLGFEPRGAGGGLGGLNALDVDVETIPIEGGGALTIPFAWGDLDLSGSGTVTEVWPDGRVLAFGHGMNAAGDIALPMASGYVHMVMPSILTSFKLSSSAAIRGTLVRDENVSVIGRPERAFESTSMSVTVSMPEDGRDAPETFSYEMVRDRQFTQAIAPTLAIESMLARQSAPPRSTMELEGMIDFGEGRVLRFRDLHPEGSTGQVLLATAVPLMVMANNVHEAVTPSAIELNIRVRPGVRRASIVGGSVDRVEYDPGDMVRATVQLLTADGERLQRRIAMRLPESMPPGRHALVVMGGRTYTDLLLQARPHLLETRDVGEVFERLRRFTDIPNAQLYAVLPNPEPQLAVGSTELPELPGSVRSVMQSPRSTRASTYQSWREVRTPMSRVPVGAVRLNFLVRDAATP